MSKKILIIEDEKAISDILCFNLKKEGYEVICAADGGRGKRRARAQRFNLLDVMLPSLTALRSVRLCARV